MTWYLITSVGLHKMEGDYEVERVKTWPDTKPSTLGMDNVVVNLTAAAPKPKERSKVAKRSPACDSLIMKWEGYHKALPNGDCAAYPDPQPSGLPVTIGWGTTRYNVVKRFGRANPKLGDIITKAEAKAELEFEIAECERTVLNMLGKTPVTQGMVDSLVSFAYNLGISGASAQINRCILGKYEECAKSFDLYVKAGGKVFQGLINRRNEEEALFRSEPFP